MTEHLPIQQYGARGPLSDPPILGEYIMVTYADHLAALRDCEKRVHEIAYAQGLGAGSDEHRQHEIGWIKGYDAALDDAREAVLGAKAIDVYYGRGLDEPPQFIWLNNALSAIDALREDQP